MQSFGSDIRTALMHKMADFTSAKKQMHRHASDISALRRQMASFQGANALDGIDFKPYEEAYDAEKEALKRRVTLLTDLCEQNGVIVPPAEPYQTVPPTKEATVDETGQAAVEVIARAIEVPASSVPALLPGLLQETKPLSPSKLHNSEEKSEKSVAHQLQSNLKTLREGNVAPGGNLLDDLKAPQPFVPQHIPAEMEVDRPASLTAQSSAADLDQSREPPSGC